MSATLDAAAFLQYFKGARAIYVQGRQFPVQLMYTPQPEDDYLDAALTAVMQARTSSPSSRVLPSPIPSALCPSLYGCLMTSIAFFNYSHIGIQCNLTPLFNETAARPILYIIAVLVDILTKFL
jgi:hypothetical protein